MMKIWLGILSVLLSFSVSANDNQINKRPSSRVALGGSNALESAQAMIHKNALDQSSSTGSTYVYIDKNGQALLTRINPSGKFDKFPKRVDSSYKDMKAHTNSTSEPYLSYDNDEISKSISDLARHARDKQRQLAKKPDAKIGMSKNQVLNNSKWGQPKNIITTVDASGKSEKWLYSKQEYLHFKNDKLISMHY